MSRIQKLILLLSSQIFAIIFIIVLWSRCGHYETMALLFKDTGQFVIILGFCLIGLCLGQMWLASLYYLSGTFITGLCFLVSGSFLSLYGPFWAMLPFGFYIAILGARFCTPYDNKQYKLLPIGLIIMVFSILGGFSIDVDGTKNTVGLPEDEYANEQKATWELVCEKREITWSNHPDFITKNFTGRRVEAERELKQWMISLNQLSDTHAYTDGKVRLVSVPEKIAAKHGDSYYFIDRDFNF